MKIEETHHCLLGMQASGRRDIVKSRVKQEACQTINPKEIHNSGKRDKECGARRIQFLIER